MAVVVVEIVGSRSRTVSIDAPSKEFAFVAFGSGDDDEVCSQVEIELPATTTISSAFFPEPRTLVIQSYSIKQREEGGIVWDGTATYGRREQQLTDGPDGTDGGGIAGPPAPGQPEDDKFVLRLNFDTTGGTAHISTAKQTKGRYTNVALAIPDFGGAIGVNGETVEGVDIVVPSLKFSYDWYPRKELITRNYIALLMVMTGTVNSDHWMMFGPGEVLFLGATGAPRSKDDWEIKMNFVASPNKIFNPAIPGSGLTVGSGDNAITQISKGGHEYLWVRFADDVSNNVGIKVPRSAHVERVYDATNFALLGIGV